MSSAFTDEKQRSWSLALTAGAIGRVRQATGVDLYKAIKNETALADMLFADQETFVNVLWVLIEEQAGKANLTRAQFDDGMGGEAIENATAAFLDAVCFFFRPLKRLKQRLPAVLARMDRMMAEKMDAAIDKALTSNASSGSSPASAASMPAP